MTKWQKILKELRKRGVSKYAIHKETGISYQSLAKLESGITTDPRVSTDEKLSSMLKKEEF